MAPLSHATSDLSMNHIGLFFNVYPESNHFSPSPGYHLYKSSAALFQIANFITSLPAASVLPCKGGDPSEAESRPCNSSVENSGQSPYNDSTKHYEICIPPWPKLLFIALFCLFCFSHTRQNSLLLLWHLGIIPFGMLSPQILTWLSLPFKSLPKHHSQAGTPSLPHFKLSHLKKKIIFPRNSGFPLTLLHFSKHLPLNILYYSLLPIPRRGAHKGKFCFVHHSPLVRPCLAQNRHAHVQRTALPWLLSTCLSH